MKNIFVAIFILLLFLSPKIIAQNLLKGKGLKSWDTYLGAQFPENSENRNGIKPVGLNVDPKHTFSVITEDGDKVLHITGEQFGGISTKKEFENYHLQLQFKWGNLKWHPKKNAKMDSGLLYHANGEQGADNGFWMQAQEFQIQQGDCGDYWGCAGAYFDAPTRKEKDSVYVYDPKGEMRTFKDKTIEGRRVFKFSDAENPTGQWNTLDLYCFGDTAIHIVNGKTVNVLYHSSHIVNEKIEPLTKGKIQLQSEGAEIYFKNIEILSISAIPAALLKS